MKRTNSKCISIVDLDSGNMSFEYYLCDYVELCNRIVQEYVARFEMVGIPNCAGNAIPIFCKQTLLCNRDSMQYHSLSDVKQAIEVVVGMKR